MPPILGKIATFLAVAALGAAAGAQLTRRDPAPQTPARPASQPVEVRTQVVHRTVRVIRHVRPKAAAAPPRPAPTAAPPAPVVAAVPAATTAPVAPVRQIAPAPAPQRLSTHSSGAGSSGGEREHESEHEGGDD